MNIFKSIEIAFCDHEYFADTQIKVIRCEKCGDERWYDYKNLYPGNRKRKTNKRSLIEPKSE